MSNVLNASFIAAKCNGVYFPASVCEFMKQPCSINYLVSDEKLKKAAMCSGETPAASGIRISFAYYY